MGSSDDDGPDARVSLEVGIAGVIVFTIVGILTGYSLSCAKNKYSWRMFACSTLMAILEIPRYLALIAQEAYTNRGTYILHMWGSVAFFAAFTCVIYMMHDAVDLSQSHSPLTTMITSPKSLVDRIVIDKTALVVVNLLFALLTFVACISCLLYNNLENYFHESIVYKFFTLADGIKNIIVAFAFSFYGWRLKKRINAFYDTFGIAPSGAGGSASELEILVKLRKVVRRLLTVMAVCMVSFLLRTAMLIIKGVCVEEDSCNLVFLPNYGMLWWILSDFIPRAVPILSFVIFFGNRPRPQSRESKSLYGGVCATTAADGDDGDLAGNRQALLAELEEPDEPDRDEGTDISSMDGSGHQYRKLRGVRESTSSMDSYETTSSSHTVYRNTATTNEFSTSYRPHGAGHGGRKSESMSYFGGSVIVNALMWPINSSNNPYRNSSHGSSSKLSDQSGSRGREPSAGAATDSAASAAESPLPSPNSPTPS